MADDNNVKQINKVRSTYCHVCGYKHGEHKVRELADRLTSRRIAFDANQMPIFDPITGESRTYFGCSDHGPAVYVEVPSDAVSE